MTARLLAGGALLALLALGASGCGDNGGSPTGFGPGGQSNAALLFLDVVPVTPDSSQVDVFGDIYDFRPAVSTGFRLYVNPANEGFRPATEALVAPSHTFSTGTNLYRVRSLTFDPAVRNEFMARGARNGFESAAAPLTQVASTDPSEGLLLARRVDVPLVTPADSALTDSVPTLTWANVPEAVRYRLKITGRNGINYLAIVDGTSHQVEGAVAILIEDIPMRPGLLYRWSVDAIDAQNRIIGTTRTTRALLVQ